MIKEILNKFNIEGELINITENHSGNINKTFVATFKRKDGSERKYLIQKINTTVFAEPYKLMKNIEGATAYLKRQKIISYYAMLMMKQVQENIIVSMSL